MIELTSDNKEKIIFERDIVNGVYQLDGCLKAKGLYEKINNYAEDIRDDGTALFLAIMNHSKKNLYEKYEKAAVLQEMYHWIKDCLDINYPDSPISSYSYMASMENVEEICKMIAAFGTGITDYKLVTVPVDRVMSRLPKERKELLLAQLEKNMNEAKKETGDESVVGIIMQQ